MLNQTEEVDLVYFIYFLRNICSAPQGNKFCGNLDIPNITPLVMMGKVWYISASLLLNHSFQNIMFWPIKKAMLDNTSNMQG